MAKETQWLIEEAAEEDDQREDRRSLPDAPVVEPRGETLFSQPALEAKQPMWRSRQSCHPQPTVREGSRWHGRDRELEINLATVATWHNTKKANRHQNGKNG